MSFKTVHQPSLTVSNAALANFAAPTIDLVTIYGGLNYLALFDPNAFIIVQCGPVGLAQPGDKIDLYWSDNAGDPQLVGTQPIGDGNITVSIQVPVKEILRFGTDIHSVYYNVVDSLGNEDPSLTLPVTIKLTVPGAPYDSGENDSGTPYINEALLAPTVAPNPIYEADLPAGATVTIAPWENMFEGDVLTLNWGGLSLKQAPLLAADLGKSVVIKVDRATLENGGSSASLPVRYEIRDIVNNWSLQSLPDFVNVNTDINLLDAPDVVDEAGGELDYDSLAGAVAIVTVDTTQAGISQGDDVTLYWDGTNAQGAPIIKKYTLSVSTTKLRFQVPNADVALFIGGNLSVSYTVFPRSGGTPLPSSNVSFTVLGEQKDLPAPKLLDGLTGMVFEPATLPATGARVSLQAYPGMDGGDRIILSWQGKTSEGTDLHGSEDQTLEASDVGLPFVFTLEKDEFLPLGDATKLTFSYTVIFAGSGGTRNSEKVTYDVKQAASGQLKRPEVKEATSDDMLDPADPLFTKANVQIPDDVLLLAGDRIDMLWDSPLDPGDTDDYMNIKTNGKGVTFQVSKARVEISLRNEVFVSYTLTRGGSKLYESKVLTLFIGNARDRLLPAPSITEVVDGSDVLDPADVNGYAHVVIKATDINVAVGDEVLLNWAGSKPGGSYEYSEDISGSEAGKDVTFDVPRQYVDANLDGTLTVDYTVIRGTDGSHQGSHPLVLSVGNVKLEQPSVKEADGNSLDPIKAKDTLTIVVPGTLEPENLLSVTWQAAGGAPAGASYTSPTKKVSEVGQSVEIPVSVVAFSLGKAVNVSYSVTRGTAAPLPSPVQPITIKALPVTALTQPRIVQAQNEGEGPGLELSNLEGSGAEVRIDTWPHIAVGQRVWLRLSGKEEGGAPIIITPWNGSGVSQGDINQGYLTKTVSYDELKVLGDSTDLTVSFSVTFDASSDEATAVVFPARTYTVSVLPSGTLVFSNPPYVIAPGGRKNIALELSKDDAPIPGAGVTLKLPAGFSHPEGGLEKTLLTDATGKATFSQLRGGLVPGGHTLTAASGSKTAISTVTVSLLAPAAFIPDVIAYQMRLSPDGTRLAYLHYYIDGVQRLSILNTLTGAIIGTITTAFDYNSQSLWFNHDSTLLYIKDAPAKCLKAYDTNSLVEVARLTDVTFKGLAVSPDGSLVYVARNDLNALQVLDARNLREVTQVPGLLGIGGVSVSDDGAHAYVTAGNRLFHIDTATSRVIKTIEVGKDVSNAEGPTFSPDGNLAYIVAPGTLIKVDTSRDEVVSTLRIEYQDYPGQYFMQRYSFSPDRNRGYVWVSGGIVAVDTQLMSIVATVPFRMDSYNSIAAGPDGKWFFATWREHETSKVNFSIIDTATFGVRTIPMGSALSKSLVISLAGTRAYIGLEDLPGVTGIKVLDL